MPPSNPSSSVIGDSPAIKEVLRIIRRVADADVTVLLTGESGTGKEVAARQLHDFSQRSSAAFVAVNCASIPANLLEAELFGYEKGAFTDAKIQKKGLFELAEAGTLFLDEVGLMPIELQAKLLTVLESRRVRRLGGTADILIDTRFVAATNEDLENAVASGRFREDLYFRLNVVPVELPPLRDRQSDAMLLAQHFLKEYAGRYAKPNARLSAGATRWLQNYAWPGNIRELRNVIERAILLSAGEEIQVDDLALGRAERQLRQQEGGPALSVDRTGEIRIQLPPWGLALEDVERQMIAAALKSAGGNVSRAAALLHVSRDTLRYRIRKHGIPMVDEEEADRN